MDLCFDTVNKQPVLVQGISFDPTVSRGVLLLRGTSKGLSVLRWVPQDDVLPSYLQGKSIKRIRGLVYRLLDRVGLADEAADDTFMVYTAAQHVEQGRPYTVAESPTAQRLTCVHWPATRPATASHIRHLVVCIDDRRSIPNEGSNMDGPCRKRAAPPSSPSTAPISLSSLQRPE